MAVNSNKPYTPEEDLLILACPRVPGATKTLAARLGRERNAISLRRAVLMGTTNPQRNPKTHERKFKARGVPVLATKLPIARPAWFSEPDFESRLVGRR